MSDIASSDQPQLQSQEIGKKSFLVTWLLSLLLGWLGIDRFYLGKVGTGLLKLFTLGGVGVWYLVDLILVLAGAQKDEAGGSLIGYEQTKVVAWIVSGVLILASAIASASGSDGDTVSAPDNSSQETGAVSDTTVDAEGEKAVDEPDEVVEAESTEESPADSGMYGLGDVATTEDGIEVSVYSVAYGVPTPNEWIIDVPKGELAVVDMEMFNGGEEQISLSTSSVVGYIDGLEYEASALFGPDGEWYLYEDVNPRLGTTFSVYFDIPPGTQIGQVEFSSASFFVESVVFNLD